MSDTVKKNIAAMLAKTEANGATEAEAVAAMRTARKLMRKHGLTLKDIAERKETAAQFVAVKSSDGAYKHVADRFLAAAIGDYTETRPIILKSPGVRGVKAPSQRLVFFGYRVDVDLADFVYKTCRAAIDNGWDKYKQSLPKGARAKNRIPYQTGIADRLTDRIYELTDEPDETTGTDLIVLKNALVNAAFEQATGMDATEQFSLVEYDFSDRSYRQGYIDGDEVAFHRSVTTKAEDISIGE